MKKILALSLAISFILTACSSKEGQAEFVQKEEIPTQTDIVSTTNTEVVEESKQIRTSITRPEVGAEIEFDPPYDYDPDTMYPWDFGEHFATKYDSSVKTYLIGKGTEVENEVTMLTGKEDGPTIYIVAGLHGDEIAGWMTGNLIKKASIKAGKLYILSPANAKGANRSPRTRYITDNQDMNRNFPGTKNGSTAKKADYYIFNDIKDKNPVFLFDLHEARVNSADKDFLGSSLIYSDLKGQEDLFFDLITATEDGTICQEKFNYYSPGPDGSINKTVTTQLGIPTITVETFRGYQLEQRISDQLDVVEFVLEYYGLR